MNAFTRAVRRAPPPDPHKMAAPCAAAERGRGLSSVLYVSMVTPPRRRPEVV